MTDELATSGPGPKSTLRTCHQTAVMTNKFTYYGRCSCGWMGPERWLPRVAKQDAKEHREAASR